MGQLSPVELEQYNREIKIFHQKYNQNKSKQAPVTEKLALAINGIMPMPMLNHNLHRVFDEPKRIAKGSLIECPCAKKSRLDIEQYLLDDSDSEQDSQREQLKMQLQKEIAINSDNFDVTFADGSNYLSDPIVFNCRIKSK